MSHHLMINLVNDGTYTEIDTVPWDAPELASSADEGAVGSCSLIIDDDDATFNVRGHRQLYIYEDEASGDPFGGVIWYGRTAERDIYRGALPIEDARQWTTKLVDTNAYLTTRVMVGADCKRPNGETDLQTVAWLMATNEMGAIDQNDTTYIDSTGGVAMSDDRDYTGQTMLDILDDCAQQSGRNYFLFPTYSGDPDARVSITLWYKFATSTDFSSSVKISNLLADVDDSTYYAPAQDTKLTRDPSQVYSGVYQAYDAKDGTAGSVYVVKAATRANFMARDVVAHGENVKTAAAATARAERYLNDVDAERDTITTAIQVTAPNVNAVVAGHRIEVKFSHLPGYEAGGIWMRVRERTVRVIGFADNDSTLYELALTLVGPSLEEVEETGGPGGGGGGTVYAFLTSASGPYPKPDGAVYWDRTGDDLSATYATQGPFTYPASGVAGAQYTGIEVGDNGTVDVTFNASCIGVMGEPGGLYTFTWYLLLNGAVIDSAQITDSTAGLEPFTTYGPVLSVSGLAVSNGDLISARFSTTAATLHHETLFRMPWGVAPGRLEITGGSF